MVEFVTAHADALSECELVTTGTTGKRIADETGLAVNRQASGPLGGDLQIGAKIADGDRSTASSSSAIRSPHRLTSPISPRSCGSAT